MFIPNRGRGFVVGLTVLGCLSLSDYTTGKYFRDGDYYSQHGWPKLAAFWAAAGIIWWMMPVKGDEVLGVDLRAEQPRSVLASLRRRHQSDPCGLPSS
jgi:hypothetical protein